MSAGDGVGDRVRARLRAAGVKNPAADRIVVICRAMAGVIAPSEGRAAVEYQRERREALRAADAALASALRALGPLRAYYRPRRGLDLNSAVNWPVQDAEKLVAVAKGAIAEELKRNASAGGRPDAGPVVDLARMILGILARVGGVPDRRRGRVVRLCLDELGYSGSADWVLKRAKAELAKAELAETGPRSEGVSSP